ncbi:glycoside hydrolase family 140 protein [Dyadobacter jiangsuensis]|uniref:Collagenase-like protein with putative collagen-binding domain n=1 Tax=Dyadobacter jiangsuensis TaxID=1591085 RepID=A0A2P8G206_9BACT|nr:glycoside hydrolase family 140 protein [Dyadobacter jiangsuensis]PSL27987.1 collagenase-like protein with putative collagen-binding domain [Dyadobacter jiangsuensis]
MLLCAGFIAGTKPVYSQSQTLKISENKRFFTDQNGEPFFWLADTGWLLFNRLTREEADRYLTDRQQKGFNVVQVMVVQALRTVNVYGDSALVSHDLGVPKVTDGNAFENQEQYDYWDHVDYVVGKAAEKGIKIGMVPIWGNAVKNGKTSASQAKAYAQFLARRYRDRPNIVWINGGDIQGDVVPGVWEAIGSTLRAEDPNHLITFHPFGRMQSSKWFHDREWLDFNMFQSGHRTYAQDNEAKDLRYGEDNWRYVEADYARTPVKPVLDGEPSYENIWHGLHDKTLPVWTADDVRRYAYWSVFAGACGFTYGNNAVMQMRHANDPKLPSWEEATDDPGASQMVHLKNLMLSKPYFERVPDQALIAENGERYDRLLATRGKDYALIYTWNGRDMKVNMGKIGGARVNASWYDPRTGQTRVLGKIKNKGIKTFNPPGEVRNGNDWVLVLEK